MPAVPSINDNIIVIVADSCRYDSYLAAATPVLDSLSEVHLALAQATYTFPAHIAMLQGFFPHVRAEVPLYNRYIRQLIRLGATRGTGGGDRQQPAYLSINNEDNLVAGLRDIGYNTVCSGAVTWFKHPFWKSLFSHFLYEVGLPNQVKWVQTVLDERPTFMLLNIGETHEPYSFLNSSYEMPPGYQIHKLGYGPLSNAQFREMHDRQIAALEYIDSNLLRILSLFKGRSLVIFTADHGECFGEDGFFGHGFYHSKVMEVPLAIFQYSR
jgi:hypothetical protein